MKKLGVKPGNRVALLGAPRDFKKELADLPAEVKFVGDGGEAEVAIVFALSAAMFEKRFFAAVKRMTVGGMIWSRNARTEKPASKPPAPPSRCPVMDFVELTASL